MRKNIYIILFYFCILLISSVLIIIGFGEQYSVSDYNPTLTTDSSEARPGTPVITTSGGSKETTASQPTEYFVSVKKMIMPNKKGGYNLGEPLRVLVEIKNVNQKVIKNQIKDIFIREIIDDNLGVSGYSGRWKKVNFEELCEIKRNLSRDYTMNLEGEKCVSWPNFYGLFDLEGATKNGSADQEKLKKLLYDKFDVDWATKDDTIVSPINYFSNNNSTKLIGVQVKSSNDDLVKLIDNFNNTATLDISGYRKYPLSVENKNKSHKVMNSDYYLGIHLDNLSIGGDLLFWYDINPKKSGIFGTETLIRFVDEEYDKLHDLNYPIDVEIKKSTPKFEIDPKLNKLDVYSWNPGSQDGPDWVEAEYDITYLGGGTEPTFNHAIIELDKPSEGYYYYINEKCNRDDSLANSSSLKNYSSFNIYETKQLKRRIAFPNTGSYSLPGVWINGEHYTFKDERITVDNRISRNLSVLSFWIAIFSLLLTFITLFFTRKDLRALIDAIKELKG